MGKRFAPSYANIFMANSERAALMKCPKHPLLYLRFLDDIFIIWTHTRWFFGIFQILNSHHPSVTLTANVQDHSIDFLDTTLYKGPLYHSIGRFDTKVFFKTTDTHQLLHHTSFHPSHTFKGVLKSQIRYFRICSNYGDFEEAVCVLFKTLRTRGYTKRLLRSVKSQTVQDLMEGWKDRKTRLGTHCVRGIHTDSPHTTQPQLNLRNTRKIIYSNIQICEPAVFGHTHSGLQEI